MPGSDELMGPEAVARRFRRLQQLARHEMMILDKPPYLVEPDGQDALQRRMQASGVRYRTIYHRGALDDTDRIEELRSLAISGEQARVLPDLPMKLVIADRRIGLVPQDDGGSQAVLLGSSPLLTGLIILFDMLWERATPLWPGTACADDGGTGPLTSDEQRLLALLAAGLTDRAIARKLGVAQRTVERRVRRMMDKLGARTRLQAGLHAAGWE